MSILFLIFFPLAAIWRFNYRTRCLKIEIFQSFSLNRHLDNDIQRNLDASYIQNPYLLAANNKNIASSSQ